MKFTNTTLIAIMALCAGFIAYPLMMSGSPSLGGVIPRTVTATNVNVTTATTSIYTSTAGLQKLEITNLGPGVIYCAFGADASLKNGLVLNPLASTTQVKEVITDPAYLSKGMNCIGGVAASTSIVKYTNY